MSPGASPLPACTVGSQWPHGQSPAHHECFVARAEWRTRACPTPQPLAWRVAAPSGQLVTSGAARGTQGRGAEHSRDLRPLAPENRRVPALARAAHQSTRVADTHTKGVRTRTLKRFTSPSAPAQPNTT